MRTLVYVNVYPTDASPAQGAFVREYARAAALHADVAVLCIDGGTRDHPGGHRVVDETRDGIRTLRLSYRRPPGPLPHLEYRRGIRSALDRLAEDGYAPDVIHAHYFTAGGYANRLGARLGVPVVISEHSSTFPAGAVTGVARWRAKRTLERAAMVLPVSEHLAENIRAAGIEPRMRVVTNTVDTEVFRPGGARARTGGTRLAFVGLIRPGKGLDDLLHALASLESEQITLDVAGDGPARAETERLAAGLGLGDRIRFLGELGKPEVAELLQTSDLFVLPSHAETQGVVLIEAMACGLPVLATAVGGIPETVDENSGVLVPPRDPEALAGALGRMLGERGRFDRTAIAERAHARFGYATVGEALSEVFTEVTTGG